MVCSQFMNGEMPGKDAQEDMKQKLEKLIKTLIEMMADNSLAKMFNLDPSQMFGMGQTMASSGPRSRSKR